MACFHLPTMKCDECKQLSPQANWEGPYWLPWSMPPTILPFITKRGSCIEDEQGRLHVFTGKKFIIINEED